ncbi:hypothetical protein D9619_008873 [Psilocybe cf. subviscida]|uniref:Uncharacterized protein n=1 Tax=Psilocybe cf. subviscida TaxID=2480587 RepID=A0A8H5BAP2_9AGAR|nr:hypothetical protein D9619_008873 [Psilocybe cf. subviscida]
MKGLLYTTLFALTLLRPTAAQTSFLYKWAFNDPTIQDTIPACTPLAITVSSFDTATNATKGTPPYYMVTLGIDGPVSTKLIGLNDDDVSFTLDHAPNTRVLLEVFDANGNPGGTFAPMIVTGDKTSCVVDRTSSSFTFAHNITGDLSTCDPLGLAITGGVPPYTVSLIAANSPAVTNVTMPEGDNVYTYISRAAPGGQLVVAISDAKGNWASGTALFATKGSTNTDCPGLLSSSTKTVLTLPSSTPPSSGSVPGPPTASGVVNIQTHTPTSPGGPSAPAPSTTQSSGETLRGVKMGALVAVGLSLVALT